MIPNWSGKKDNLNRNSQKRLSFGVDITLQTPINIKESYAIKRYTSSIMFNYLTDIETIYVIILFVDNARVQQLTEFDIIMVKFSG